MEKTARGSSSLNNKAPNVAFKRVGATIIRQTLCFCSQISNDSSLNGKIVLLLLITKRQIQRLDGVYSNPGHIFYVSAGMFKMFLDRSHLRNLLLCESSQMYLHMMMMWLCLHIALLSHSHPPETRLAPPPVSRTLLNSVEKSL